MQFVRIVWWISIALKRSHVATDKVDGNGIIAGGTHVKALFMATNP